MGKRIFFRTVFFFVREIKLRRNMIIFKEYRFFDRYFEGNVRER